MPGMPIKCQMNDPFGKHYGDACYVAHSGNYISGQIYNILSIKRKMQRVQSLIFIFLQTKKVRSNGLEIVPITSTKQSAAKREAGPTMVRRHLLMNVFVIKICVIKIWRQ